MRRAAPQHEPDRSLADGSPVRSQHGSSTFPLVLVRAQCTTRPLNTAGSGPARCSRRCSRVAIVAGLVPLLSGVQDQADSQLRHAHANGAMAIRGPR